MSDFTLTSVLCATFGVAVLALGLAWAFIAVGLLGMALGIAEVHVR